jgi:hypothetical protein
MQRFFFSKKKKKKKKKKRKKGGLFADFEKDKDTPGGWRELLLIHNQS